jgi:iron complex outermembrane receptor protein
LQLAIAACATFLAFPLHAQNAGKEAGRDDVIEEITVTAQRREQSIDDVGLSISAFSGDQLAEQGITDTRALAGHTPGLIFDGGSGQGANAWVTIRGVTQVDYSEHQEAPNAVYLDEAYVPTPSMVGFPTYDMERAEVLRGPQGTLFGRNSTGGLLQFITRDPGKEMGGYVDARYGNYSRSWLEAAIGGPLSENVGFRIAAFSQRGDGYYKNRITAPTAYGPGNAAPGDHKDGFEQNAWGVRAKLLTNIADNWTVKITGSLNRSPKHVEGVYKTLPGYKNADGTALILPRNVNLADVAPDLVDYYGFGNPGPGNDILGYRDPSSSPWEGSFNSSASWLEKNFDYGTLKVEGPIGNMTLTSVTNYSRGTINYDEDSDSTPNQFFNYAQTGETKQFTEELRLSGDTDRMNWTAGAYFIKLNGDYGTDFNFIAFDILYKNRYEQNVRAFAVFGQTEFKISNAWKLTVGARYNKDKKDFTSTMDQNESGTFERTYDFSPQTVGDLARHDDGDWAGKLALDYKPSDDVLMYASISRGIRAGGFNATSDGYLPIADTPFKKESVYAYEAGVKAALFGNRANVRAATFYYDYTNYQTFNFNGLTVSVQNHPGTMYGGELELFMKPAEGLDVSLGLSLLHAAVDGIPVNGALKSVEPVKAPKVTYNGSIAKKFEINDYRVTVAYDFNFMGKHKANLTPSEVTDIDSSWWQNARVGFASKPSRWEVYAFVNNLANVARKNYGYDNTFASLALASYATPRMYGLGFKKDF